MEQICVGCGKHPSNWRGFCTICAQWLKNNGWESHIKNGIRKQPIEAIRVHNASLNKFR